LGGWRGVGIKKKRGGGVGSGDKQGENRGWVVVANGVGRG